MLKLISLWTLTKIFETSKIPLSGMCKMVYINCLMYHFEKLEATTENAVAFDIFDVELDYEKFEKHFVELHKAGLVIIKEKSIYFENHWGQHIDRAQLESPIGKYVNAVFNTIKHYENQLNSSTELRAHICKHHKLTDAQYDQNLQVFIEEQNAIGKTYNDYKEVSSHLFYWTAKRKTTKVSSAKSNTILGL